MRLTRSITLYLATALFGSQIVMKKSKIIYDLTITFSGTIEIFYEQKSSKYFTLYRSKKTKSPNMLTTICKPDMTTSLNVNVGICTFFKIQT